MKLIEKENNSFVVYDLDDTACEKLIEAAQKAMRYTFPVPYSGYAAAILTRKGNMYTGASYVSDSHNLTMHGEAVALASAAQQGETGIVAITGPNCHCCKQLLWESSIRSKIDTLIVYKIDGKIQKVPLSSLMPLPWPDKFGNHSS